MSKQRRIGREARLAIEDLADRGYAPAEIARELDARRELPRPLPTLPTIRSIVQERRPPDPSGTWTIVDAAPGDAAIVLRVLCDVMMVTHGRVRSFTRDEAAWVLHVARAAPGFHHWGIWRIAREYMRREALQIDTLQLTHFLAFAPWTETGIERYVDALERGWIDRAGHEAMMAAAKEMDDATTE